MEIDDATRVLRNAGIAAIARRFKLEVFFEGYDETEDSEMQLDDMTRPCGLCSELLMVPFGATRFRDKWYCKEHSPREIKDNANFTEFVKSRSLQTTLLAA